MKANIPVYTIKPKYIFKSPFLKYDLQNPTNRQAQNEELTEYFNYGFNQDTMNIYAKLVNRTLKVLDHKKNLQYFDQPSQLMRLNDQIPMDLGGFCKFYDPQVFKNDFIKNDQQLFKIFLFNTFKATYINGKQYPMLEFVKSMYRPKAPSDPQVQEQENEDEQNPLPNMIDQISLNLEKKYEETMRKLIQQKNQPKQTNSTHPSHKKGNKYQKKPRTQLIIQEKPQQQKEPRIRQNDRSKQRDRKMEKTKQKGKDREKEKEKQKKRKRQRQSPSSSSSSDSSSSSSSDGSSSSSQNDRRYRRDRNKDRKDRDPRRDSRNPKIHNGQRSKDKADKRQKGQKRDDKNKDRHNRDNRNHRDHRDHRDNRDYRERSEKDRTIKKQSRHRSRSRDNKQYRQR